MRYTSWITRSHLSGGLAPRHASLAPNQPDNGAAGWNSTERLSLSTSCVSVALIRTNQMEFRQWANKNRARDELLFNWCAFIQAKLITVIVIIPELIWYYCTTNTHAKPAGACNNFCESNLHFSSFLFLHTSFNSCNTHQECFLEFTLLQFSLLFFEFISNSRNPILCFTSCHIDRLNHQRSSKDEMNCKFTVFFYFTFEAVKPCPLIIRHFLWPRTKRGKGWKEWFF